MQEARRQPVQGERDIHYARPAQLLCLIAHCISPAGGPTAYARLFKQDTNVCRRRDPVPGSLARPASARLPLPIARCISPAGGPTAYARLFRRLRARPGSFCMRREPPGGNGKPRNQDAEESGARQDRIAARSQTQADGLGTVEAQRFVGARRGAWRRAADSRQRFGRAYEDAYSDGCPFRSAMPCLPRVRTPIPAPPSAPACAQGNGIPILAQRARRRGTLRGRSAALRTRSLDGLSLPTTATEVLRLRPYRQARKRSIASVWDGRRCALALRRDHPRRPSRGRAE